MISRNQLTRMLRDASDLEEASMGFLTEFVERYFDWSGFDQKKAEEAKRLISRLRTDSERHFRIVEAILTSVSERRENEL